MPETPASIVARDRRLTRVRLELVAEELLAAGVDAPQELASLLIDAEQELARAAGQPQLEEWISAAERVLQAGVHVRYPAVYLTQLARSLARIADSNQLVPLEHCPLVARVLATLPPEERALVDTTFAAAVEATPGARWIAGLLQYDHRLARESLLAKAHYDLSQRERRLRVFLGGSDEYDAAAVLDLGHSLRLRKTRRAERERVEDWSAIDALAARSDTNVEELLRESDDEASAYLAAICAYRLGRFETCVEMLCSCLRADDDVEEYWHLLAFAKRHLGHYDAFERIVFRRERNPANFS